MESRDWKVKQKTLDLIQSRNDIDLQHLVLCDATLQFKRLLSHPYEYKYELICDPQFQDIGLLILDILEGKTITITAQNANYLSEFAAIYDCKSLRKRTAAFLERQEKSNRLKTVVLKICWFFWSLVRWCGVLGKILMTSWDFYGVIIVVSGVMNLVLALSTMGIYTVTNRVTVFVFVVLPFALFSFYFTNLAIMCVLEFFKFGMFGRERTIWPTHQQLVLSFVNVVSASTRTTKRRLFGMKRSYEFMHGILFIVFVCLVLDQAQSRNAVRGVEFFVTVFVIGIPPIKYALLCALYAMHGIASRFQRCRRRFREMGDFSDPFLCSMYFGVCPIANLVWLLKNDKKEHAVELDGLDQETPANQKENLTENPEAGLYFNVETDMKKAIAKAIFSKTVFAVYVVVAAIVFMATENDKWTAGSVIGFVIIFILIMVPFGSTVSFPWFLIRAFYDHTTNQEAKRSFEEVGKKGDYLGVFFRYVANASKFRFLKFLSIILNGIGIILCLASILLAVTYEDKSSTTTKTTTSVQDTGSLRETYFRKVIPPICTTEVKGLSIMQMMYLILSSRIESEADKQNFLRNMQYFFPDIDTSNSEDVEVKDVPFPDPKFKSGLGHIYFPNLKLHVFTIRGTDNLIDAVVDAELWCSTVWMEVFGHFVPFLSTFDRGAREYNEDLISLPKIVFKPFSVANAYIQPLLNYIQSVTLEEEDAIIVGHSLGGGLSKILSLITGYQGLAVSGPGTKPVRALYRNSNNTVRTSTFISIIPDMDVVGRLDADEGTVLKIPCRAGSIICHDVDRDICQVSVMCDKYDQVQAFCASRFSQDDIDEWMDDGSPHVI